MYVRVAVLQIVRFAVYRMLPKNLHRRTMMTRLHLFADEVGLNVCAGLHEYFKSFLEF